MNDDVDEDDDDEGNNDNDADEAAAAAAHRGGLEVFQGVLQRSDGLCTVPPPTP